MKAKNPSASLTVMTEIVLPNDTNNLNNLFGGQLLSWMDRCAAIAAHRHCRRTVVTASVNNVSFNEAIPQGAIVTLESKVSRAFSTSMEVWVDVYMDDLGRPIPIQAVEPETEEEQRRYDGALRRRQLALILSGKMKPEDAHELKALFLPREDAE
jgi:acyl-CoA hydrolase